MNLMEIATREQEERRKLKASRQALAISRKESAKLEEAIAESLRVIDDLEQHAKRAFDAARGILNDGRLPPNDVIVEPGGLTYVDRYAPTPDSAAALSPPAGDGEGGSPGTPPDAQPGEPSPSLAGVFGDSSGPLEVTYRNGAPA